MSAIAAYHVLSSRLSSQTSGFVDGAVAALYNAAFAGPIAEGKIRTALIPFADFGLTQADLTVQQVEEALLDPALRPEGARPYIQNDKGLLKRRVASRPARSLKKKKR